MKNLEELKQIRDRVQMRSRKHRVRIVICMGTCSIGAGARQTMNTLVELINKSNKTDIIITSSGCAGFCAEEPMVQVYIQDKNPVVYWKVDSKVAKEIFEKHVLNNKIVQEHVFLKERNL
ncbi:(2Fe-2S) ferredoxin domain-containing protein [bacterium]|nr:(2Fe-2S) ferredoxin domain-containing protein [bacterium]